MSLAAALGDRGARARRAAVARSFGRSWQARPEIARCLDALNTLGGAERAAACALHAVRPLIEHDGWLRDGMAELARLARADPLFEPPFRAIGKDRQQGLELLRHPAATVSVLLLRPRPRAENATVGFPGRPSLIRFVRGTGCIIHLWRKQGGLCRLEQSRPAADGSVVRFDGVTETWTLADGPRDALILQALSAHGSAIVTEHDVASGRLVARSAGETGSMRLALMATVLRQLGRTDAAPLLADASRTGPPHLRWHLLRELVALDRRTARPALADMAAHEPDPTLRSLAARTAAMLPL